MTQSKLPSFLLTTWLLLGTIATKSRMGEFLHSLQEYEIVYPRVISNENGRGRRSTRESLEPMLLEISNWTLRTVVNDRFLFSSNFTVDWVKRGKRRLEDHEKARCDLRRGSLEGDESSFVVVTICEEDVYAMMLTGQRSFFVQPLTNGEHVMFQSKQARWWSTRENFGDDVIVAGIER